MGDPSKNEFGQPKACFTYSWDILLGQTIIYFFSSQADLLAPHRYLKKIWEA